MARVITARDAPLRRWFERNGWTAAPFQREVWLRYLGGESGLLVSPTGSGKTLAACGGELLRGLMEAPTPRPRRGAPEPPRLRLLWVTPLRSLAVDTVRALREALQGLQLNWTVAMRTGDASARDKRLARTGKAEVVVITPESLALQLSYADAAQVFAGVSAVIVDEWHELLGSKRGVLFQLNLARLRAWHPDLRVWGLSATLGNLEQARDALLPQQPGAAIVRSTVRRPLILHTVLPERLERFPSAGHLGLSQLARVAAQIERARSTLLFTNTRSQAELWHKALASVWLHPPDTLALHHGSLDPTLRHAAEQGLRDGSVRCVVATSSLDLGVDFPAVEQVIQIGSPKGVARLLQRGGRARHRPGEAGELYGVPTHALEVLEYAAVRVALAEGRIEHRVPPRLSLDVLAQHCVSMALAGGFDAEAQYAEVRTTDAFATLSRSNWDNVLAFITQGGQALQNYPDFHRVVHQDGRYTVVDRRVAFRHRLSIGTIASDGHVAVRYLKGGGLGSVEEAFIGRLRKGDRFQFAGKTLELVQLKDMTAYVRQAPRGEGLVPRWQGGRLPLSSQLGALVQQLLGEAADGRGSALAEMRALRPLLASQASTSCIPGRDSLLAELHRTRDGWHLCLFPFAGRSVNEGLAALVAYRLARQVPNSFGFAANDYGLIITARKRFEIDDAALRAVLTPDELLRDLLESMNMGELARRQFRDIARVAGLLPPSLPGRAVRSMRQLQASSGLLYDVLRQHDPGHLLLEQAEREVMEEQLDVRALQRVLDKASSGRRIIMQPRRLTPLAFPLWVESLRGHLSNEDWKTRVERAALDLEAADD